MTDLHDTEGDGGFLGAYFMARPVVGGHFAFLTLGRACGGEAVGGLGFLEDEVLGETELGEAVERMRAEREDGRVWEGGEL